MDLDDLWQIVRRTPISELKKACPEGDMSELNKRLRERDYLKRTEGNTSTKFQEAHQQARALVDLLEVQEIFFVHAHTRTHRCIFVVGVYL